MKCAGGFLLLALAGFTACAPGDGSAEVVVETSTKGAASGHLAPNDLRLTTAHAGVRRLEFLGADGVTLSYREEIVTDGHGNYALRPLDGDAALDWSTFELLQVLREGFLFRYRDLVVRHAGLLRRNWEVTPLGTAEVAGRTCRKLRVERNVGEPIAYELAIDRETELVLASQRLDAAGKRVASMHYESFRSDPDKVGVAWHVPANDEQPLLLRDIPQQLGLRTLEPRLLPEGFVLYEAATVSSDGQQRWLKLTYTDGLEPLFFFQKLEDPAVTVRAAQVGDGPGEPREVSRVTLYTIQNVTVAQGRCNGFELIAMGPVPEVELLDLLESALP